MINKEEVQHIAKLARLGVTKKEEERFQKNLSSILDYFNSLEDLDVSDVEPTFYSTDHRLKREFVVTREDKEKPQKEGLAKKLVESAPDKKEGYVKVKSILP